MRRLERVRPPLRLFAVMCLGLSACNRDTQRDSRPEPGAWKPGEEWRVVCEAQIGSTDGEGPEAFGEIVDVTLDSGGRAWVADRQRSQIQVFDPNGRHIRSIGRKGAGPEEFGGISGMAWAPDGHLWVLDAANARFSVYDTTGQLVTTHPRNSIMTTSPWPGRFDDQGRVYDLAAIPRPDGSVTSLIVRYDGTGQARDTFRLPEYRPETFAIAQGDRQNQRITHVGVPFTGRQTWTIDPKGFVWIANTARYRIERHAFGGGIDRVIERHTPPVPVTRAERSQIQDEYRRYTEQGITIDMSRVPDRHPPLSSFLFDDAGNLWVSIVTSPAEGRGLDVFDPAGRYLGRVRLPVPRRTALRAVRGDRMALVSRDSLDVQTVVVLRIQKPAG